MTQPTYRAVLHDPSVKLPEPDQYGTLTISAEPSHVSHSHKAVHVWAYGVLKTSGPGSYVEIFCTQETLVNSIAKEEI